MSKSERIRDLGRQGLATSVIAAQLGVNYQHAYKVLKSANLLPMARPRVTPPNKTPPKRPILTSEYLLAHGFRREGAWSLAGYGVLMMDRTLDRGPGVYAFALDGVVLYVGVATRCIANRLGFYRRPATSQRTNVRLNALLLETLAKAEAIDVLVARPEPGSWNGLPINTCAGLELGIIHAFQLSWNQRN
jgi:hypothetical protein